MSPARKPKAFAPSRHQSGMRARVDLTLEMSGEEQRRLNCLYADLRSLDHYELLGVSRLSEKKEIKRAFFDRIREFHPDRYFGKQIGDYKRKLEIIIARMTDAHDTLCSPERRAEYDASVRAKRMSLVDALMEEVEREMEGAAEASRREEAVLDDPDIVLDRESVPSRRRSTRPPPK